MYNFKKRITEPDDLQNGFYHEEFFLDRTLSRENDILMSWGIGRCHWGKRHIHERSRFISSAALSFVTQGNFLFKTKGGQFNITPGYFVFLDMGQYTFMQSAPSGDKWSLLLKSSGLACHIVRDIFSKKSCLKCTDFNRINAMYEKIYHAAEMNDPEYDVYVYALLRQLKQDNFKEFLPDALKKSLIRLDSMSDLWISRRELADTAGVSVSTLNRLFTRYLHTTLCEYRIRKRMERACSLLSIPDSSVKAVADECGYSSTAFFSREFKQNMGMTPSQYIIMITQQQKPE